MERPFGDSAVPPQRRVGLVHKPRELRRGMMIREGFERWKKDSGFLAVAGVRGRM